MVYGGAVAVALLALVVEGGLAVAQRHLVSPGIRETGADRRAATYKIPGPVGVEPA